MKISSQLKQIRKSYLEIEPPSDLVKYGWVALSKEIEAQEKRKSIFLPFFARNIVFATIVMVLLGGGFFGLVKASESSLPGDILYPLKKLSETITTVVSGDKQIMLEKRAEEIVGIAKEKNDPVLLKDAVKEYQKAVSKTEQEVQKSGKKEEFQNKLKKEEQQFKDASEQVPSSKDILKGAIEASQKGRGNDVKSMEIRQISPKIQEEVKKSGKK